MLPSSLLCIRIGGGLCGSGLRILFKAEIVIVRVGIETVKHLELMIAMMMAILALILIIFWIRDCDGMSHGTFCDKMR